MQGGLPNAAARGKSAAMSPTIKLAQEQEQAGTKEATKSDDDVIEEIQGHLQDGRQHVYICHECGDHYVCHEISIDE
jgi:rubrerythrin